MNERTNRLFEIAKALMPAFLECHKDILGERKGIYLAIQYIDEKVLEKISGEKIGDIPTEKINEKMEYAFEKINRMRDNDEFCSFQSENEDRKQFGGGIKARNHYIAPSGFPPHLDQKFAMLVALIADELPTSDYVTIKELSLFKVNMWREKNGERALSSSSF